MATTAVAPLREEVRRARDHRWLRFIARRTGRLLVSLWILVTAAFLMIHLIPGDPVRTALGPTASAELVAAKRESLGLNDPLPVQYIDYLRGLLVGDFGISIQSSLPAVDVITVRLPATASLALLAFVFAVAISVPVGVIMAVATRRGRRRKLELGFATGSVLVSAIPDFLLGVALVAVFGVSLGWLPIAGRSGPESYILPVIALSLGPAAVLARIVRVEMLGVLEADFVRTARAKRLPAWRIHLTHALPNAVTAALTLGGLLLGSLVVGTVLVENVFAWPGLGSTIVSAIQTKDYPMVQATVLVYGAGVLIINTVVDAILAALDPRTTVGEH
ncbi:ABC transporter permease [Microbacterium lushaniae]|uniref:ABC transporter permease n=1 Tax=Microbacterium lushaniae TaxID=2614639 RepID=A0A5J5JII4_9MICO|nr:ABC transporter permease [Microbacterium lushaniae]KAA9151031.1 ABC transporter permease [Microbacterium lushaniae]KAA9152432.1 ABC transporter permease [Microbacterium lushaniae]QEW02917.1 ABC transporter permease [Microbacterium lushaniae]